MKRTGVTFFFALSLLGAFGAFYTAHAADSCEDLLTPTENFIAYLDALVEQRVLELPDLHALQNGEIGDGPRSKDLVHRKAIRLHLQNSGVDRRRVAEWAARTEERLVVTHTQRRGTEHDTRTPHRPLSFVKIPSGEALVPLRLIVPADRFILHTDANLRLSVPAFEITTALINQGQWLNTMPDNPSHSRAGTRGVTEDHLNVWFDTDQPLENATWWSVAEFANRYSIEHGLPPFYLFDGLNWKEGTKAEDGTLEPAADEEFEAYLAWQKSNDPKRTDGTGYRLPKAREWYRVLTAGLASGRYQRPETILWKDIQSGRLRHLGWFQREYNGFPHSTADETHFIEIGSHRIFDIVGNLWQWTSDLAEIRNITVGRAISRVQVVGGSFATYDLKEPFPLSDPLGGQPPLSTIGFRLARTLPESSVPEASP